MELIVVGAGIAGSSVTRIARERGHHVTLISIGQPASSAAVAVMRHSWHRGAELRAASRSLELLKSWDVKILHGAMVSNARTGNMHNDDDFHAMDPIAPLLAPDIEARVSALHRARIHIDEFGHRVLEADQVIDCRGYASNESSMTAVLGATLIHSNTALWAAPAPLRVHHIRPYKSLVAARLPGQIRIGSSTGKDIASAVQQVQLMLGHAEAQGIVRPSDGWRIDVGIRSRLVKGASWYMPDEAVPRIRGLYRTGYSLAPAAAERLIHRLEGRAGHG